MMNLLLLGIAIVALLLHTINKESFLEMNLVKTSKTLRSSSDDRIWRNPSKTWISTHYSDTGSGSSAIPFSMYPLTWKGKTLFPAAVHERDNKYLYHVLAVTLPDGKKAFVHVMDFCNMCHDDCKSSVEINGRKYSKPQYLLLDIHEKAFESRGFGGKPRNSYNPKVASVGVLTPKEMKGLPKGVYFIDSTKRCNRSSMRRANCDNKKEKDFFGDYCSWST
jgi:hypothetical protein